MTPFAKDQQCDRGCEGTGCGEQSYWIPFELVELVEIVIFKKP